MSTSDTNTVFKRDEIVLLLGAGASVPASIPASQGMIDKIEQLLDGPWDEFKSLYFFVKSAIQYADGIHGRFDGAAFNVEKLVETLDDLRRGDEHPLYPFVGAWVPKLYEVAGSDLKRVTQFREEIVRRLRDDWIPLQYNADASYYTGLAQFQSELQEPLRLFTLNYDLCVESAISAASGVEIERGFAEDKRWDWRRFEHEYGAEPPNIYLYKLHGSIDWTRDENDNLIYRDAVSQIDPDDLAIIFGTPAKLQAVDPFLFFAYELRKWTLESAKLIVTVGYGFADDHINGILRQSLRGDSQRKLLAVTFIKDDEKQSESEMERAAQIAEAIGLSAEDSPVASEQIVVWGCGAETLFNERLTVRELGALFPQEETLFDEIGDNQVSAVDEQEPEASPVKTSKAQNGEVLLESKESEDGKPRSEGQKKTPRRKNANRTSTKNRSKKKG